MALSLHYKIEELSHPTIDGLVNFINYCSASVTKHVALHFSIVGVDFDPRNDTSIAHGTIVGNKVCMTYNPPAKTEMRAVADLDQWPAVSASSVIIKFCPITEINILVNNWPQYN